MAPIGPKLNAVLNVMVNSKLFQNIPLEFFSSWREASKPPASGISHSVIISVSMEASDSKPGIRITALDVKHRLQLMNYCQTHWFLLPAPGCRAWCPWHMLCHQSPEQNSGADLAPAGYRKNWNTKNGLAFDARIFFFPESLLMLLLDMSVFVPVESCLLPSWILYCYI